MTMVDKLRGLLGHAIFFRNELETCLFCMFERIPLREGYSPS